MLAGGLAGAAALALAPAAAAAAAAPGQGAALTELIRAEEDASFAYLEVGLAELGAHEREHARALAVHLEALGMPIPGPARGRDGLGAEALAVLDASEDEERRQAAIALERALMARCAEHLPVLEEPGTVRTVATVMASHAQHAVIHELADRR